MKTSRLNLEAFKAKLSNEEQEAENLTGAILGTCHDDDDSPSSMDIYRDTYQNLFDYLFAPDSTDND